MEELNDWRVKAAAALGVLLGVGILGAATYTIVIVYLAVVIKATQIVFG